MNLLPLHFPNEQLFHGGPGESVTPGPSTSSRRGKKVHPGRFAKGHKRRALFITPTKSKRASIPKSELLKETKYPQATSTYNVTLNEGGRIQKNICYCLKDHK